MAKTRAQKEQIVADLTEKFSRTKSLVFAEFSEVGVTDLENLRAKAREEDVGIMVAKKTLLQIAANNAGFDNVDTDSLPNSVVTVMGFGDEVMPAKLIADFAKGKDTVTIQGGVLEGAFANAEKMVALSKVPSKPELYAKLVGSLNAPVSGFVNALSGNLRNLVYVLKAVQETKA